MGKLSTNMCRELAHRASAGIDVTLIWVHANDEDKAVVCVCDRRAGAYFEIQPEPDRRSRSTTTRSPTGTAASSTTTTVGWRRSHGSGWRLPHPK